MSGKTTGRAHSVQVRLVAHAKRIGVDPELVLTRFAVERFLYRLSKSQHAERFVLKGALLMLVWLGETIRATRDADLLGFGELTDQTLEEIVKEICAVDVEPDGLEFLPDSVKVAAIRVGDAHGGRRVLLMSQLGAARLRVQVNVGIGDAVVPDPEWMEYPSLLGFPAVRLRAYRPETSIAEELHAMVALGSKNSRMKDFFNIYMLAEHGRFDGPQLIASVRSVFERRRTAIPTSLPLALTPEFAKIAGKGSQWTAFLRRSRPAPIPVGLEGVLERLAMFLSPVLAAAGGAKVSPLRWPSGGPWENADSGDAE